MTWAEAKEAFVNRRDVSYKGGTYTVNALINRLNGNGIFIRQVELKDMRANSVVIVNESFIEVIEDAE